MASNSEGVLITSDSAGNVHVVWGNWIGSDQPEPHSSNTIFYKWWDGSRWSDPVDVLAASGVGGNARVLINGLATTGDGRVVVHWISSAGLLVSDAAIGKADDARNWHTTLIDSSKTNWSALAIDEAGERWYVVFVAEDRDQIRLISSEDAGLTWREPIVLWTTPASSSAPSNPTLSVASDGTVHLAWSETTERREWAGEAIWYARMPQGDEKQIGLREVARSSWPDGPTMDWPALATNPTGAVHLFWNNGVGSQTGRFHEWSEDSGVTWSGIEQVFPGELSGQTGRAGLVFDSAGTLHIVTSAAGPEGATAVRYFTWRNGQYAPYQTLSDVRLFCEYPGVAITNGHQLHVVRPCQVAWRSPEPSVPYYISGLVEAPVIGPKGFAEAARIGSVAGEQPPVTVPVTGTEATRAIVELDRERGVTLVGNEVLTTTASSSFLFTVAFPAALTALFVLVTVVFLHLRRSRT
ncbi:MAG: sialidase family protein [Chloroflexi bacterium]|nr:sialidase family protein [Chloroflexota bacterium]